MPSNRCIILVIGLVLSSVLLAFTAHAEKLACGNDCLSEKALGGDGAAAIKLANDSLKESHEAMVYWYRIAAENGSATGQYNYGVFLVADSKRRTDCIRALFWFKMAEKQGKKIASDYIAPLEEQLKQGKLAGGCANVI